MDSINAFFDSVEVFRKLGINSTVIFQFIVFVVTFLLLEMVFFSKLLFVIQQRENKTTKLDCEANGKFAESENLAKKFNDELQGVNIEAQAFYSSKKSEIIERERQRFKKEENKVNDEVSAKRSEIEAEFQVKKESLLQNAEELSNALSKKLTV